MAFYQKGFIVGKVLSISTSTIEAKNGKTYTKCSAFIRLPNGASMNIDKMIEMKDDICDYFLKSINSYNEMKERIDNKTAVYVCASVSPDSKNKMWDTVSTYVNDEGKMSLKFGGLVKELEYELDDKENVIIKFNKKDVLFNEIDCSITIEMIAKDIIEDEITFDSLGDYPVELIAYLPDGVENKAETGQGYKLLIEAKKGQIIEEETDGANLNWDSEVKEPSYASDYFEIKKVFGKSKNYVDPNTSSSTSSLLY